jgi:uncharacterized membrane protein YfcA
MELLLIGVTAFLVALMSLFSGFGLGTVLMPVFSLFFPIPLAIAATAVVHFANNIFKFGLMAKYTNWNVTTRFGIPAVLAALAGAILLQILDQIPVIGSYSLGDSLYKLTVVKMVVGFLIIFFAVFELLPWTQQLVLSSRWLPIGGAISGFFGGLSGNQGALRSAFLLKAGMTKNTFVATGIALALFVDASRLIIYGIRIPYDHVTESQELIIPIIVGTVCAFCGSFIGKQFLQKITIRIIRTIVTATMMLIGTALFIGLI